MYVKLISSDGHEFIIKRDHALTSGTIKVSGLYGHLALGNVQMIAPDTCFLRRCCLGRDSFRRTRPTRSTLGKSPRTSCRR